MSEVVEHTFPILPDPQATTTNVYGVYDLLGDGLAAPATFVIDGDGVVQWNHVGNTIQDRPSAQELLDVIRGL